MKALILAAGFGTRLLPHTRHTPKALFPLGDRTLLDRVIGSLCRAGCRAAVVNTHHLADRIEAYVRSRNYPIPVSTRRESEILGTGGAIRNLADFWDRAPFMVVNSDIVTDIDLGRVYADHLANPYPVTLVLADCQEFNTVSVDAGFVSAFGERGDGRLAFTGIQVVDPEIIDWIPREGFCTSIDTYRRMIAAGLKVRAWTAGTIYWKDIGTPQRYFEAAADWMAPEAFRRAGGKRPAGPIRRIGLAGDGSDRKWYRLEADHATLVLADHGIRPPEKGTAEVDATVAIGRHLKARGLPVPEIYLDDRFAGLVFFEDLGDASLQSVVSGKQDPVTVSKLYEGLVRSLVDLSQDGAVGFDPTWAWQGPAYDHDLIMEKECRYFLRAFMGGYLGLGVDAETLNGDFEHLATEALVNGVLGFMHRDLQSRNIMVRNGRCYFVDYQGGRLGPIQYDLASLLIDPYVRIPDRLKHQLVEGCARELGRRRNLDPAGFRRGFDYCAVCRNLQILGAFGFLSREKKKPRFATYIPPAVDTLKRQLSLLADPGLARLKAVVDKLPGQNQNRPPTLKLLNS